MREITKTISVPVDGKLMDFRLTKLDAFSGVILLRQLLGELSDSARETLLAGFPDKEASGSLSALPDLLASASSAAAPAIHQTANSTVQAPVSINVTAAGTNPEAVGRSIYDVTERYLLRTLNSAM